MKASDSRPAHANAAERRTILDVIPAIVWCKLPDGSNEFVNQRWQDYTGIPADEARGQGWRLAVHPEDRPRLSEKWAEIVASGKSGEFEGRLRRHDGAFRWVLARFEPVRDATSEIVRWYGTSTDIDALKRAEEKLREDERALRRITDTIPQNIVVLDPDGIPIYANRATLDYTGLTLADVVSSDFRARVFHPEDLERVRDQRQAALAAGVPFEFELRALSKEGQYRWFLTRYKPFHDEQGRLVSWYATGTDIDDVNERKTERGTRMSHCEKRSFVRRCSKRSWGLRMRCGRCWRTSRKWHRPTRRF
jgi:PAS domain S-box-containing protein